MPRSKSLVAAALALFVCSVLNTRCPVCAARNAILAVSASRISPTRITSGSCRKMERKAAAKVNPHFLVCSAEFVFHRIFDGRDVDFSLDDFAQTCVKRCRLAASCGACNEEQPLRCAKNSSDALEGLFAKVEVVERFGGVVCGEQAQHAFFAVAYGYGAETDVHLLVKSVKCKTAVVGESTFRNVDVRDDFQADHDGLGKPLRKRSVFCQKPVDAEPYTQ